MPPTEGWGVSRQRVPDVFHVADKISNPNYSNAN